MKTKTQRPCIIALFAALVAALLATTPAHASLYYGESENVARRGAVGEHLPEWQRSDTLAAVNDGILFPERPHDGNGPNPYAWSNYESVQSKYTPGGGFYLDFEEPVTVNTIVLYQFVDSWSASLPEEVYFFSDGGYGGYEQVEFALTATEQLSPTCVKMVYQTTGGPLCGNRINVFEREAEGRGDKVVDRCVGVYEVEMYEKYPHSVTPDPEPESGDPVANIQEGWYNIVCAGNPNFALDVNACSAADGTNIQIWGRNDTVAQRFYIVPLGDEQFMIFTGTNGLRSAVGFDPSSPTPGTNIAQSPAGSTSATIWSALYNPEDGSFVFIDRNSRLALDFEGARYQNGTNVALWTANGSNAQRFVLVPC